MNSGYYYVGSPYSNFPGGIDAAYDEICRVMAKFVAAGVSAWSPIAHCHSIAKVGGLNPLDHKIWLPFCGPMMTAAKGLIVAKLPTWKDSFGLNQEIAYFGSARRPIRYLDPETMLLDGEPLELIGRRQVERLAA